MESEHKKALRLREQAEKKIQKLEAEIMEDKKKYACQEIDHRIAPHWPGSVFKTSLRENFARPYWED